MKPAARNFLFALLVLIVAARPGLAASRDLLTHGTDQFFWAAEVLKSSDPESPGEKTVLRFRTPADGVQWRPFGEIAARAVALSDRGSELLVLLEGGDWKFVTDSAMRLGNPLPGGMRIIDLAGDGDDIWAIGIPSAASASAATRSGTSPATAAAASGPRPPSLFVLNRGDWAEKTPLPLPLRRDPVRPMSLIVIDRQPMIAASDSDRGVHVYAFHNGNWSDAPAGANLPDGAIARLLNLHGRPMLWLAPQQGAGSIMTGGERWSPPVALELPNELKSLPRLSLAVALGQIRVLASDGKGRLFEQIYTLDGKPSGKPFQGAIPITPMPERFWQGLQVLLMVVLLFVMLGTMRRRESLQDAVRRADRLALAPIPQRIAAGVIDATPLIVAFFILGRGNATAQQVQERVSRLSPEMLWVLAAFAVYLLHTTLAELLMQRTIGKVLFGLRVSALDGGRAGTVAILARNLFRVFDVVLIFPLTLVIFSPLRQRVGDVAAGTIVVRAKPLPPAEDQP